MSSIQREHDWLVEHHKEVEKYAGRCIAILSEKVVASGKTLEEAYRKATRKHPGKVPLVIYVLKKSEELLIV